MEQEKIKNICGYDFKLVEEINLVRNEDGEIYAYNNSDKYKKKDQYALFEHCKDKLFCKFKLVNTIKSGGVYLIIVNDGKKEEIKYVGKANDFSSRWNSTNYGLISPRNCYKGGQSTNCKVNNKIYEEIRDKKKCFVYLHIPKEKFEELKSIECKVIEKLKKEFELWNTQQNCKKHIKD